MEGTPRSLAQHYLDLSNQADLQAIEQMLAPDAVYDSETSGHARGREAILAMMRAFFDRFATLRWEVDPSSWRESGHTAQFDFVRHCRQPHEERISQVPGTETLHFDPQGQIVRIEVRQR